MLRTEPSFCVYTCEDREHKREDGETEDLLIGDVGSGQFSFRKKSMGLIEEEDGLSEFQDMGIEDKVVFNEIKDLGIEEEVVLSEIKDLGIKEGEFEPVSRMYLATGLGLGGGGRGGSGDFSPASLGGSGNVEEYYKRMVGEDPSNPLFLGNYAQLLQSKGDLHGAEDYFFRATSADPKDGEICTSYAKLVWELHRDQDRASNYFEQAARAAPNDSRVLAAYASFLWKIEEDENEDCANIDPIQSKEDKGENIEEYGTQGW